MVDPFLGQINAVGFNFAPRGWALCDGQLLPISQNTALFSLLGTTFGGDGRTTFGLPDLRGRSMVHVGNGPGLSSFRWGQRGGAEQHVLTTGQMPNHGHLLTNGTANVKVGATTGDAINEADNGGNGLVDGGIDMYAESPTTTNFIGGVEISGKTNNEGGSQAFQLRNPYLAVYQCIAMTGVFPSRS